MELGRAADDDSGVEAADASCTMLGPSFFSGVLLVSDVSGETVL